VSEEPMTPGTYLEQQIEKRSREVAKTNSPAGHAGMLPGAANEVIAKYPNLSPVEKASLRGSVEEQVRLICARTGCDPGMFTVALQEVARILG
jgi:hypothetical protein